MDVLLLIVGGVIALLTPLVSLLLLMQDSERERVKRRGPCCERCHYSFEGLTADRCPECGLARQTLADVRPSDVTPLQW